MEDSHTTGTSAAADEASFATTSQVLQGLQVGRSLHLAGRDVHHTYNTFIGCSVSLPGYQDQAPRVGLLTSSSPSAPELAQVALGKRKRKEIPQPTKRARHWCTSDGSHVKSGRPSNSSPGFTSTSDPVSSHRFSIAKNTLRLINKLVAPHAAEGRIFNRIAPCFAELEALIVFASDAHDACSVGTVIGSSIRRILDARMGRCNRTLDHLHSKTAELPHRSFPLIRHAYQVVHEWWTGNEAEEIASIRSTVSTEVLAIGEWLRSLHSLYWASNQLLQAQSKFTMKDLSDFLKSGPISMLRDIDIEEVIFLEPLQGGRRSIPLRFVNSFEDVHAAVEMACQGTAASRFIENRQYQLDDPTTDVPVQETDALQRFKECQEYEITIFLSRLLVSSHVCPRCDHSCDGYHNENINGWVKCRQCGTKFNAYTSEPGEAKTATVETVVDPSDIDTGLGHDWYSHQAGHSSLPSRAGAGDMMEGQSFSHLLFSESDEDQHGTMARANNADFRSSDAYMAKLFRRLKYEAQPQAPLAESMSSLTSHTFEANRSLNEWVNNLNSDTVPPEYRKEGPDWYAVFNPKAKRDLDISLAHSFIHESVVCCVHFSHDGRYLATGCSRTAQVFDTKSGQKVCELPHENEAHVGDLYIRSVRFSPDGKLLATAAEDRQIRIWDIARRRIRQIFDGHQQQVYSIDISQDCRLLASGSGDCTTRIWDMADPNNFKVCADTDVMNTDTGVTSVAISPSTQLVASASLDSTTRLWDVYSGQLLMRLRGHTDSVYNVAFTPDGKGLVTGSLDKTLKHWDICHLNTHEARRRAADDFDQRDRAERQNTNCIMDFVGHKEYVISGLMSSDGRWVVSGSKDCCAHIWDSATARLLVRLHGHKNTVLSVDLSPDKVFLATGSGDWLVRIWRLLPLSG